MSAIDEAVKEVREVAEMMKQAEKSPQQSKKLYKVELNGWRIHASYVVAENSDEAYRKVRNFLDSKDWGFREDRELKCVTLIAENTEYPACGTQLFV